MVYYLLPLLLDFFQRTFIPLLHFIVFTALGENATHGFPNLPLAETQRWESMFMLALVYVYLIYEVSSVVVDIVGIEILAKHKRKICHAENRSDV